MGDAPVDCSRSREDVEAAGAAWCGECDRIALAHPLRVPSWRDELPERYGPITVGDYASMVMGDHVHFVRFTYCEYRRSRFELDELAGLWPMGEAAACGEPIPFDSIEEDPTRHPIAGVVDCEGCLEACRRAKGEGA